MTRQAVASGLHLADNLKKRGYDEIIRERNGRWTARREPQEDLK